MQEAFGYVLFGTVAVAAIVALVTFLGSGKLYDQIGRGGLSLNEDGAPQSSGGGGAGGGRETSAERLDEIRQLLEAKSAVRQANGKAALDVDAEIARITAPALDPEVLAEIREMVERKNARRVRKGEAALDVEAEVERQIRDLRGV